MLTEQIPTVQKQLKKLGLAGWLLYDYCGSNPIAHTALGLGDTMLSRRLFYFIPASGVPSLLYHRIDQKELPALPGRHIMYIGWRDLNHHIEQLAKKCLRDGQAQIAMEYFPDGSLPQLSRVDAGTIEWLKRLGFGIVPSAQIVQYFLSRLSDAQASAHREAAKVINAIKDEAFELVAKRLRDRVRLYEYELQQFLMERLYGRGLLTDYPPVVATGKNTSDPHYLPSPNRQAEIKPDQVILIDVLGRHDQPVCAYADITWVGYTGRDIPAEVQKVFDLVLKARDAGLELLSERYDAETGEGPEGWEVDRAVRQTIETAGYGSQFPHRAGHSLGTHRGHGDGANIDDLETHDTRKLVQGMCFSLKPGVYLDNFGVRSEIDVYMDHSGPSASDPIQSELVVLG